MALPPMASTEYHGYGLAPIRVRAATVMAVSCGLSGFRRRPTSLSGESSINSTIMKDCLIYFNIKS
jgi:hypothetical protein